MAVNIPTNYGPIHDAYMGYGPNPVPQSDNPKNVAAKNRVKISLIPPAALAHCAHALMDGAAKYGPYNWREKKIGLMEYASASIRHIGDWVDGEDLSDDALCHHLGHVMACCAIMLDSIENDCAIDDRPKAAKSLNALFKRIEANFAKALKAREPVKDDVIVTNTPRPGARF